MKPSETADLSAPTLEQLQERLQRVDTQIEAKQAEAQRLQNALPHLIAEYAGSDLAAMRERRQLKEATELLADLKRAREVVLVAISDAERLEAERAWKLAMEASKSLGEELEAKAAVLQGALGRVVELVSSVREADELFCASLKGGHPHGFDLHSLTANIARRIELSLYVLSKGALRPRGLFESYHEMELSGRADLKRVAKDYTSLALRGRSPPRLGPPDAA